jgi:hypothetical protein
MKLIECSVCGRRTLGLRTGAGRILKHRNAMVPVPDDVELPECTTCGSRPIPWKLAKQLEPVLEAAWSEQMRRHVAADLEILCGVKPLYEWERLLNLSAGYLSKLKGDKTPSAPLVALLRLLANQPERARELEALWQGEANLVVRSQVRLSVGAPPAPLPRPPIVATMTEKGSLSRAA